MTAPANELKKNLTQTASRRFIEGFKNNMVALTNVDRQILDGLFNAKSGDSVTLKVPTQYKSVDLMGRTNGAMTDADIQAIQTGTISAKVNFFEGIALEMNKIEEALESDQLDELLNPATKTLVQKLESAIFAEAALMAAGMTGSPSSGDVKNWLDARTIHAYYSKIGAANTKPKAFGDTDVITNISEDVKTSFDPSIVAESIRDYYGGRLGGVDFFETESTFSFDTTALPTGKSLASDPSNAYATLDDVHTGTLTLNANTTVKKGMKFTIDGYFAINQETKLPFKGDTKATSNKLQVFTVTKDSAGTDVSYSPAIIGDENSPFQNVIKGGTTANVTFLDLKGKKPTLAWSSDAVAVHFVPLKPVSTAEGYTATDEGVAIRTQKQGDVMGNTDVMRFDVMAVIKVINPMKVLAAFNVA